jgi:hypothetical protein
MKQSIFHLLRDWLKSISISERISIVFLILAVILNIARFGITGTDNFMIDFHLVYVASDVLNNEDINERIIYSPPALQAHWEELRSTSDKAKPNDRDIQIHPFMYPPFVALLVTPFTWFSWSSAQAIVIIIELLCLFTLWYMLLQLSESTDTVSGFIVGLFILAFKPIYLAISSGQPVFISVVSGIIALYIHQRKGGVKPLSYLIKIILPSVLLVISAVKPTVAVAFFVYFVVVREWHILLYSTVGVLLLNGIALYQLPDGTITMYINSLEQSFMYGAINDYNISAPTYFDVMSPQGLFTFLSNSDGAASLFKWLCFAVVSIIAVRYKKLLLTQPLHAVIIVSIMSLLTVYHRVYDITIILLLITVVKPKDFLKELGLSKWLFILLCLPLVGWIRRFIAIDHTNQWQHWVFALATFQVQIALLGLYVWYVVYLQNRAKKLAL